MREVSLQGFEESSSSPSRRTSARLGTSPPGHLSGDDRTKAVLVSKIRRPLRHRPLREGFTAWKGASMSDFPCDGAILSPGEGWRPGGADPGHPGRRRARRSTS
jgi:hypothetical protein